MIFRKTESKRRGSVLMELVVVLPLYFLLFGGVFMLGGVALSRIRMHLGDHLVTWVGGSRFCPTNEQGQKDPDKVRELVDQIFGCAIGGIAKDDDGFEVRWDSEGAWAVNDFMGMYYGGVTRLPVNVPSWIRGMMGMGGVMFESGTPGWLIAETSVFSCGRFRSYSFHRLSLPGIDNGGDPSGTLTSRAKSVPAKDVATRGYLETVLGETWIGLGESDEKPGKGKGGLSAALDIPKGRLLGRFGE